ncbi:MAG: hypothetical protein QM766_17595 [Burkholderiaceae bacterium]
MLGAPEDVPVSVWTGRTDSTILHWFSPDRHGRSGRWEIWQRMLRHPLVVQRLALRVDLAPPHRSELSLLIDGRARTASLIPVQPRRPADDGPSPPDDELPPHYLDDRQADAADDPWQRFLASAAGSARAHRRAERVCRWWHLQAHRQSRIDGR